MCTLPTYVQAVMLWVVVKDAVTKAKQASMEARVLQAMGDNMVAVIPAFAQHLNQAADQNLLPDSPATSDSVYFDLLGLWMISYRASVAEWIHSSALPLVLLFPPPGVRRGPMAKMAGVSMLSLLSCLAAPAAVGGLRAFLSGKTATSAVTSWQHLDHFIMTTNQL